MVLPLKADIGTAPAEEGQGGGVLVPTGTIPYQRIVEAMPHIVWIADNQGDFEYVSAPWARSAGPDRCAASAAVWQGICHPLDHASIARCWRQALATGEPSQIDVRLRKGESAPFEWGLVRVAPLRDARGNIEWWIGTFTPLEAHREYEQVLCEEIIKRDEFLAVLAHELRNSSAVLRHGIAILEAHAPQNEGEALVLRLIKRQGENLESLIDDLCDLAKIMRGKISIQRQPVSLGELLRGIVSDTTVRFGELNHRVDLNLPTDEFFVEGDKLRLSQIFTNILVNAHKFTPPGGAITVRGSIVKGPPQEITIAVEDTGGGIPHEVLPRIFDLFSQGGGDWMRGQGGLGIGLALVKQLVELHGGTVTATSLGVNRGTTMTVRLPSLDVRARLANEGAAPAEESPLRILIVDDDSATASLLCEFLRVPGRSVRVAGDGIGAIQTAINFKPELILLDLGLPRFDGCQVARRLRALPDFAATPIIALDDSGLPPDEVLRSGFTDRIPKPVSPETLRNVIDERLIVGRAASKPGSNPS